MKYLRIYAGKKRVNATTTTDYIYNLKHLENHDTIIITKAIYIFCNCNNAHTNSACLHYARCTYASESAIAIDNHTIYRLIGSLEEREKKKNKTELPTTTIRI